MTRVLSLMAAPGRGAWTAEGAPQGPRRPCAPVGLASGTVLVAAATGVAGLLKAHSTLPSLAAPYLIAVAAVAVAWGLGHAVAAAVLSLIVFDFLYVPPAFALTPADPRSWLRYPFSWSRGSW